MRDHGRRHLTDVQVLLVALLCSAAVFLSAMAWGMSSLPLFLIAVSMVVLAGVGFYLLGLRFDSRATGTGTAYVVTASRPPIGHIVGRCDLKLLLDMPGARTSMVKFRDPSAPTSKWPTTGDILPVDINPRTRRLRIRWDLADMGQARSPDATTSTTSAARADDMAPEVEYTPTPPSTVAIIDAEVAAPPARGGRVFLDDDMALGPGPDFAYDPEPDPGRQPQLDYDDTVRNAYPAVPTQPTASEEANTGHPAEAGGDAPERGAAPGLPARGIPQPRPSGPSASNAAAARRSDHECHALRLRCATVGCLLPRRAWLRRRGQHRRWRGPGVRRHTGGA